VKTAWAVRGTPREKHSESRLLDPINVYLRKFRGTVISAEGIRAQESDKRATKPVYEVRKKISMGDRLAYTWNPILSWKLEDVWEACGTSSLDLRRRQALYREGRSEGALDGWPAHSAYVYGNERLSCALCVMGSKNDLRNGAMHNPGLFRVLTGMERESGFSFKSGKALSDLFSAHELARLETMEDNENVDHVWECDNESERGSGSGSAIDGGVQGCLW
jgi:3'-phosphoadenosine 5'-phosphosulfate sulfotransferase (PAPS reductase)/FAD synthetase